MVKYEPFSNERCPQCLTGVQFIPTLVNEEGVLNKAMTKMAIQSSKSIEDIFLVTSLCPSCGKLVITASKGSIIMDRRLFNPKETFLLWPRNVTRYISEDIPSHIASDYKEAAAVLSISPKASAALSRRCLQAVLREEGKSDKKNLVGQILEVMPTIPSYIAENVDAIRHIGNFSAHPTKDMASGEIVDVEPGEAEWNLDILDMLFDFYYVQPAIAKKKRSALNDKLKIAGKEPMKSPNKI